MPDIGVHRQKTSNRSDFWRIQIQNTLFVYIQVWEEEVLIHREEKDGKKFEIHCFSKILLGD